MNPLTRYECEKCGEVYESYSEALECCRVAIILNEGLMVTYNSGMRLAGVAFLNSADSLKDEQGNPHQYFAISADCMDRLARNWLRTRS